MFYESSFIVVYFSLLTPPDRKLLALFYTYSEDLISRNADLNQELGQDYVRLKLVYTRNTMYHWVKKTISKRKAKVGFIALSLSVFVIS